MGDSKYQHPVALHWDQGPEKLKPLKNKLQLYFGSKGKSDGGECEIRDTDCTRGYVLIYYKEEAARDRVLQRKTHHLKLPNGTTLQLIVRLPEDGQSTQSSAPLEDAKTPPSTQEDPADHKVHQSPGEEEKPTRKDDEVTLDPPSSQVLIENIQDRFSPEMLNLLVENISGKNEDIDFHVERIPEIQSAVVTFTSKKDIPDFIERFSGSPRAKQQNLRVKCLENTRSVRLEGLPANTSEDFLELYLESTKHGGGPIEKKEMLPEEGAAIITFSSPEVVKTFLTKPHTFHNSVLSVYPYYPSIGQWLYGKKNNDIMTPGPVECPICAQILEFIFNNEEIKQSIEKQMTDHYCEVKWPKPGDPKPLITLSFPSNLSAHLRTLSKIAPTWSNKVQAEFSPLMSKYKVLEYDLKPLVWEDIREKVSSSPYDGVLIKPDLAAEKAFIVGISEDVEKIEPIFKKLVEETTRQLCTVEDKVPLEPAAWKIMLAHDLEKSVKEDSPHVKISYDGATTSVKLYGPKDEVLTAKREIINTRQDLKSKSINRDPSIIQFLMAVDNEQMSRNLFHNIKAMFQVEDNAVMLVGYTDKDLNNAEEILEKEMVCKRVALEDKNVTQSPEWGNLKSFLNEMYNADGMKVSIEELPGKKGNEVVITGLSSSVEEAYRQIQDFVGKNTLVQKDIKDHKVHQSPGEEEKPTRKDDEVTLDPPSSQVLIENIQDRFSPEMLNLLVENISGKNEDIDFHVERIPEIQSAVVTFTSKKDIPDFIERFSGSPRAKQQNLRVKCLENTRSVRLEGLPANTSEDFLELYLESTKHGGGPIEKKEMLPEEGAAIITFSSPEVVKTFLTKRHMFHNSVLSVYPYYPSIGQWLYGKKNNDIMTPGPVECPICAQILEFIFNNEEIKQSIEKQMTDHYCEVKWPNPGDPKPLITLSFPSNLSAHLRTLSKIAPTWSNKVQAEFSPLMSKYKVIEYDLKPPVWEDIRKKVSSSPYDGVLIKPDLAAEKAFIVGISEDVEKIEPIFKKLVEETTRQLCTVEDKVPLEPAAWKIMLAHDLEKSIKEDSPHLKISYDGATTSVKLYGPKDEVLTAKREIINTRQDLKSKSINRDPSIIQFLMAVDNEEMSRNLFHNNIKAMFQVEDNAVMLVGYTDKDLKNAEEILEKEMVCKRVALEDKNVTQSPEWGNLKSLLNEMCNADEMKVSIEELPGKKGNEVVITGLSSSVEEAYGQIQDFVGKNTVVCVARMDSTLHSDTLNIDKPGAKKFCIDNEDMYISTAKNKYGCAIYFQKDGDTKISGHQPSQAEPLCQVNFQNEVTLALYKGDLCQHRADAIIIASNKDLKPSGGPALALLKAAGPKLQKECERIVQKQGELEPGENEITDVENLPCKKVIHAVGPKYSEKDKYKYKSERLLRKVITRSLEAAAENVLNSAAISVASFIVSGIPADICVENILKAIKQYTENEGGVKSIKNIHLVDNDDHTLKTLTKFLKEEYGEENVQVTPNKSKKKPHWKKTSNKEETIRKGDRSMVVTKEGVHVDVVHRNIEDTT
ncbi:protein mono-ADP-ribosyltransferase PARP14-like [Aquarana catesbeiana]|uniref:protein mono-ADP-ribosyltransferase PARP14-like n=1 Tax=Aquarana catesbeiana TaxID=8400 RepID=UPI003CC9236C